MKKLQWAAGLLLSFSVIAILLISSFEIAMYADFSVYQKEYENMMCWMSWTWTWKMLCMLQKK